MKTLKKTILIILAFLGITICHSQDQQEKGLSFHAFSFSPEVFFVDDFYSGGFSFTADVSWSSNGNIFALSTTMGEEYAIWGSADNFQQVNLLYGREIKLIKWFYIDTYAGLGMIFYNSGDIHLNKLTIPLVAKIRFKVGQKFSIGFKIQSNFNSVVNMHSAGVLFQWNY